MGLTANLVGLMVMETARALTGEAAISCTFPPTKSDPGPAIVLGVTPTPSLRDLPGLFRVTLDFGGKHPMRGTVQQARASNHDAVILRGTSKQHFRYAIGLSRTGQAVLTIQAPANVAPASRQGLCIGHDKPMQRWKPN